MLFRRHCTDIDIDIGTFSGISWATLHCEFACSMLSQEYYDIIEQHFFMCNVVWSLLGNIIQGFYLCNIVPRVLK